MSTRSEILVKCNYGQVKLYHHHDGYIEGVGFDLLQRMKNTNFWHIDTFVNKLVKDEKDEYEVTLAKHTDIEYFYIVDIDKKELTGYKACYEYKKVNDERIAYLVKECEYKMDEIEKRFNEREIKC